jgi:hypothetical protein
MAHSISVPTEQYLATEERTATHAVDHAYHALHVGFIAAPVIAGLDKFTHLLTDWDKYLAPAIARLSPIGGHGLMLVFGVVEVVAGLLVALRPRIGGLVVSAWLFGIILNLVLTGGYYDVALRDLGLALGAFALSRLATARNARGVAAVSR